MLASDIQCYSVLAVLALFATNASGATQWPNLQLMQVPTDGQIYSVCKWLHLVAKFTTNASCATFWPNLQLMQVAPPVGQIYNSCMRRYLVAKFTTDVSGATWWANLQLIQVAPLVVKSTTNANLVANLATNASIATR